MAAILAMAYLFTNSVEMLGDRIGIGQGGVGSVLAAVGTALPETIIPVIAILGAVFTGSDPQSAGDISIGAILGAPFLLATLAMFVIGCSLVGFRRRRRTGPSARIDETVVRRDLRFFVVLFPVAAISGAVELPLWARITLAMLLVATYVLYAARTLGSGGGLEAAPDKLLLWRSASQPPTWAVVSQFFIALVIMVISAHFFVGGMESASHAAGIPAGLISLLLAPLATELPEKINSILWVRDDKDTLAFGNVTGAMVFQTTIPVTIGLLFTQWNLEFMDALAVVLGLMSGGLVYLMLLGGKPLQGHYLMVGGAFYVAFLATAFVVIF